MMRHLRSHNLVLSSNPIVYLLQIKIRSFKSEATAAPSKKNVDAELSRELEFPDHFSHQYSGLVFNQIVLSHVFMNSYRQYEEESVHRVSTFQLVRIL